VKRYIRVLIFFCLGLALTLSNLFERDLFVLGENFESLLAAGNERSFFRISTILANYPYETIYSIPESRIFLFINTIIAKAFSGNTALIFFCQLIVNLLVGTAAYSELISRHDAKTNRAFYARLTAGLLILVYSLVLLRDIWIVLILLKLDRHLSKKNVIISILLLLIVLDFRLFTFGLCIIYFFLVYYNKWSIYMLIITGIFFTFFHNIPVLQDLSGTLDMYETKTKMQLKTAGFSRVLSNLLGDRLAIFIAFVLQPSPTLFSRANSVYSVLYAASSISLFTWFFALYRSKQRRVATIVIILIISVTSGEIRHKIPFMVLTFLPSETA
jgi:hypothetical protein